ncbi:MAG: ATP-binding protein [Erysipelotrichaceae bacterium]|nr:ATP-binding protein [Erysipelotrichaceae bacterium]
MEIKRQEYLNRLINKIGNGSIKIITGLRRSGKTYLMNVLFYRYLVESGVLDDRIIRFSFESADDLNKIGEDLIDLKIHKQKVDYKKFMNYISSFECEEKIFLLLDEVQNLEGFEFVLNSYLASGKYEIYVTGSNSKFLSKDIVTEFRGRGDEIHVMPISFKEYFEISNLSYEEALDSYLTYGGLPRTILMNGDEEKASYLKGLLETTYINDIFDRYKVLDKQGLNDLLNIAASGIGSLVNPLKLSNTFKSVTHSSLSEYTINTYLEYFEDSFLLRKALRYDIKGRKYISTPYKLYFEDLGLRNARLNFRQVEPTHLMENLIYNELINRGANVDVGEVTFKENKQRTSSEIDFVVNRGSTRYYIQSAYGIPDEEKMNQELKSFRKVSDSFKKILIVEKCPATHYTEEGFLILKLRDFLLDENSINF